MIRSFKLKDLKLKHQMFLLITIVILLVFLLQVLYNVKNYVFAVGKAEDFTSSTLSQVEKNIDLKIANISSASKELAYSKNVQQFLKSDDKLEMLDLYGFITDYANFMVNSDNDILDVLLVNNNGRMNRVCGKVTDEVYNELKKYNFLDTGYNKSIFTSILLNKIENESCYALIVPVYNIYTVGVVGETDEKIGVCIIICKASGIGKLIDNSGITKNSTFVLLDSKNKVIVSNRKTAGKIMLDLPEGFVFNGSEGKKNINLDGKKSVVRYKVISATGWTVLGNIPLNDILTEYKSIRQFGIFTGIIFSILLLFVGRAFMRNITKPIEKIVQMMKMVGSNYAKLRLEMPYRNEVGVIAADINKMLDDIENMNRKIFETQMNLYEMELSKKQTELNALQSQINPHFLYNTLECLKCVGLVYNSDEVVKISTAMADIFRYSIKGSEFTCISEEMECVKNYLNIMTIRYSNKYTFIVNVDEEVLSYRTLKMILQPIVENAVYHGLESRIGPGLLKISGKKTEDKITFQISDNGKGISQEELCKISQRLENDQSLSINDNKRSIGLTNINSRIRLHFGKDFGLRISSVENERTTVTLEIPFLENT